MAAKAEIKQGFFLMIGVMLAIFAIGFVAHFLTK